MSVWEDREPTSAVFGHFPELEGTQWAQKRVFLAPSPPRTLPPPERSGGERNAIRVELLGMTFGWLRVRGIARRTSWGTSWRCECAGCLTEIVVTTHDLMHGARSTCGSPRCLKGRRAHPEAPATPIMRDLPELDVIAELDDGEPKETVA